MSSRTPSLPSRVPRPARVPTSEGAPSVLALTSDPVLERHLLSVVAAVGLRPEEPVGEDGLRRAWRAAGAVLVGVDRAPEVAALGLVPRAGVYVVGRTEDRADAYAWSTRLRAAVATVPDGAPDLADALSALVGEVATRGVVAVTGGSGGVGASTLAAALALGAARSGLETFLLDTDPLGGGIDVLLGAEDLAGWRWSRFAAARGHLGDLAAQLPRCDGVDVLALDRGSPSGLVVAAEPVAAVLDAAARTHDLAVVDLPRQLEAAHEEVLSRAGTVLLVVRADVRGVAAADAVARSVESRCRALQLVVRTGRGHSLDPELVADSLELPLAGVLEEDPAVAVAAEHGDPPGQPGRSSLARLCARLLSEREAAAA